MGSHVADLLGRLDRQGVTGEERAELRFIVLVHDAFKNRVQEWRPRVGENHHAMRARRFAERYTDDERLLTTIELHDRPYGIWRSWQRTGRLDRRAAQGAAGADSGPEALPRLRGTGRLDRGQALRAGGMVQGRAEALARGCVSLVSRPAKGTAAPAP